MGNRLLENIEADTSLPEERKEELRKKLNTKLAMLAFVAENDELAIQMEKPKNDTKSTDLPFTLSI
jgi:hypothetical protein